VTAFPANHDPVVDPLLYAVSGHRRSIFYGVDTATLPEGTWQALQQHEGRFDVVILDHTYGPEETGSDHLSARQLIEHATRMRKESLLADGARVFATHIAHEGNPPHPELASFAADHGYEVAYDGLEVTLGPGGHKAARIDPGGSRTGCNAIWRGQERRPGTGARPVASRRQSNRGRLHLQFLDAEKAS
jgi:hypothetical protein